MVSARYWSFEERSGAGERLTATIERLHERLDGLDAKIDSGLQRLDAKFDRLDAKVDSGIQRLDARMDTLDAKMSRMFTWVVGIVVTNLIAVVGALLR